MKKSEREALIKLLDDKNGMIYNTVKKKIMEDPDMYYDLLIKASENSDDSFFKKRVSFLVKKIHFKSLYFDFKHWIADNDDDILYGAYLVAKYEYPDLQFDSVVSKINALKSDVWLEMNSAVTPLQKVRILNHILFGINRFSGNFINILNPQNSFINHVTEIKKGNHISLAILYTAVAESLELPIYPVNLPKNMILAYLNDKSTLEDPYKDVLFYINPYNKGAVLGRREIDIFLAKYKLESKDLYYYPCNSRFVILRLLKRLIYSYENMGVKEKITDLKKIVSLFEDYET